VSWFMVSPPLLCQPPGTADNRFFRDGLDRIQPASGQGDSASHSWCGHAERPVAVTPACCRPGSPELDGEGFPPELCGTLCDHPAAMVSMAAMVSRDSRRAFSIAATT